MLRTYGEEDALVVASEPCVFLTVEIQIAGVICGSEENHPLDFNQGVRGLFLSVLVEGLILEVVKDAVNVDH